MQKIVLAAFAFCLLFAFVACQTAYPEGPCESGTVKTVDCNTCTCTKDGKGYVCTRKMCVRTKRDAESLDSCKPYESYTHSDGCNTCTCPASGKKSQAACTEMFCLQKQ
ncbi:protease inhibitors-like [Anabrus simplex]|uniref:protease inhibitors-like n=1 Tax=Anabrus simplex TaxID=316456 RepID=UPI0035A32612